MLEKLSKDGTINEFYKGTIMDMSERVLTNITAKYDNIQKGVGSVMVGQVLDYEAKRIRNEGQERLFQLLIKMNEAGEVVDIKELHSNTEELERLYRKYGL